jgi:hypothetical protein
MSVSGADIDAKRLGDLAARLGVPARQLVIAAARLAADPGRAADPAFRARVLADARAAVPSAEASARVLLAPLETFAVDEVDRLFAEIWPADAARND